MIIIALMIKRKRYYIVYYISLKQNTRLQEIQININLCMYIYIYKFITAMVITVSKSNSSNNFLNHFN